MFLEAFLAGCILTTSLNIVVYNYYNKDVSVKSLKSVSGELLKPYKEEDDEDI